MAPKNSTKFWCSIIVLVISVGLAIWAAVKAYKLRDAKQPDDLVMGYLELTALLGGTILFMLLGCKVCYIISSY